MSRLSWVQSPDLLSHELVASAHEGKPTEDVRARWEAAGGLLEAPVSGLAQEGDEELRRLAEELLDELESRPVGAEIAAAEPDDLAAIEVVAPGLPASRGGRDPEDLADRVLGAWTGRAAGCLLGKPVEKIPREGIEEILRSQDRWPLDGWFTEVGLTDDIALRWPWNRRSRPTSLAENIDGMPEDDDLNFPMLGLALLEQHGRDFTTEDVADLWLANLPGGRVFTAERVAYRNLLLGDSAPRTATRRNPYREWIGALIRADVYGWACPGDPVAAARLAWTDARLSHVRNGVYGAMSAAAMCAQALVAGDVEEVLGAGLAVVPPESRYAEALAFGAEVGRSGDALEVALDRLHERYGDLHWVHVLNNAAITAYALTSSEGDFSSAICAAVMGGWDTDSVGATVGSIAGALAGARALPKRWVAPMRNRVASSMPGFDGIGFDELTRRTLAVIGR
ncbi:ADP-ribosylglycohydrolase [Nocardioides terrae]|uniref:ADP-ribosylglycohydrolase n=1 Tax=Nocardioides terrae TaxID=574651 RepID=A0A1I1KBK2_9ACTN|nr:ADP-ribosylglycohydrolase family protein [Nocardioides terrae]SFC58259.1 ADP-ribosylglycohydrolase [Nocardioides terrae]